MPGQEDFSSANAGNFIGPTFNPLALSCLWNYVGQSSAIFKCPSDQSTVNYASKIWPRARTMTMNMWLGAAVGQMPGSLRGSGKGNYPYAAKNPGNGYPAGTIYTKFSQVAANPGASSVFVFLDMRADCVNSGSCGVCMDGFAPDTSAYRFWDMPGIQHNNACSFSFADGHAETKKWQDSRTTLPLNPNPAPDGNPLTYATQSANNPDIAWMQNYATRP
jgi:prepilin-type processing-associated H-X9-DG protein